MTKEELKAEAIKLIDQADEVILFTGTETGLTVLGDYTPEFLQEVTIRLGEIMAEDMDNDLDEYAEKLLPLLAATSNLNGESVDSVVNQFFDDLEANNRKFPDEYKVFTHILREKVIGKLKAQPVS